MSNSRYFDQTESGGSSFSRGDCGVTQSEVTNGSILFSDFDNSTEELRALITSEPANAASFYADEDGHFDVDYTGTGFSGTDSIGYNLYSDCVLIGAGTESLNVGTPALQIQEANFLFSVDTLTLQNLDTLTIQDATLAFSVDNLNLSGSVTTLEVNNMALAFTLDAVSLTSVDVPDLEVAELGFNFTVDSISLSTETALAIDSVSFAFSLDNIRMDSFNWTGIEDGSQEQWTDI